MLTVCGAPVGREDVGARVILLRVGLATLRCILRSAQLKGKSASRFSIEDEVRVRGRARDGWVGPEAG